MTKKESNSGKRPVKKKKIKKKKREMRAHRSWKEKKQTK